MKCCLLTVFVFVLFSTLVKGYNLPFPIGLLAPRTKYDYDLTRFFLGAKGSETSEVVNDYKDSTQVHHSPIRTTETPIHKYGQCHQNHPSFGSPFIPFDHRSEVANHDRFGFYKPFSIKFQHDPPKRPYRPTFETSNTQNEDIKTDFGSSFSFNQNKYFPTTTVPPLPSVPRVPPAPQAPWIRPPPAPQGSFFGSDSQPPFQSFNAFQPNNNKATTVPVPVPTAAYRPEVTTTTTTKPVITNAVALTSLAADVPVKYKETETDYYDFEEEDLKRPQYDLSASRKLFAEFVQKYGKIYKDKQDEEVHYQHFVNSLMSVNRLNQEGGSASFDINFMSDEDPKIFG